MSKRTVKLLVVVALLLATLPTLGAAQISNDAFDRVWERTDQPVFDGRVARGEIWGRAVTSTFYEPYVEGVQGQRLVKYYDKGKMDINDPTVDPNSPTYISSGMLVREMIEGRRQVGNNKFAGVGGNRAIVAGDVPFGSLETTTYRDLEVFLPPVADQTGQTINEPSGAYPIGSSRPPLKLAKYVPETGHNIANVFWDYLNQRGTVYEDGKYVDGQIVDWQQVTGNPLTEPSWTKIKVAGKERTILFQPFERRLLTYSPDNPPGYKVEMGNVGIQHYTWLYGIGWATFKGGTTPIANPLFASVLGREGLYSRVGNLYNVYQKLPAGTVTYQQFEHGYMFHTKECSCNGPYVYVLFEDGAWSAANDWYVEGRDPVSINLTPPAGRYEPTARFGKLWRDEKGVRERLGWATTPEGSTNIVYELHTHAALLHMDVTRDLVFILFGHNTTKYGPGRSGGMEVYTR